MFFLENKHKNKHIETQKITPTHNTHTLSLSFPLSLSLIPAMTFLSLLLLSTKSYAIVAQLDTPFKFKKL